MTTLREPYEGSVQLGDIDVLKQKYEVRKTLGHLPQEFGVSPQVSAEGLLDHFAFLNVGRGRGLGGVTEEVAEAVAQASVRHAHRYFGRCSCLSRSPKLG